MIGTCTFYASHTAEIIHAHLYGDWSSTKFTMPMKKMFIINEPFCQFSFKAFRAASGQKS